MDLLDFIKKNKILQSLLFAILILAGVLFSYQYFFQTYFAMDEWSFWMQFLKYGPFSMLKNAGIIGSLTGEIRVGLYLTNDLLFHFFALDIRPWLVIFFVLHLGNIFLLYIVLRKFKLSPFSLFLGAFYFGIASAGQEALSWPAAGIPVLGTTLFILLTILLTIKFNESKKMLFLILAIVCSVMSFFFRPTGLVTPALIVALIFLFYKKSSLIRIPWIVIIACTSAITLGLVRLLIEYSDKMSVLVKGGFEIIFYPLVTLSHIFIPYRLMFRLSDSFINFFYPIVSRDNNVDTLSHLIISDFISVVISFFILIFIYLLYKKVDKFNKKVLIFALIVFFIQYIPIALNYTDRGGLSYLESRHTYTSIIGISIIFGVFFNFLLIKFSVSRSSIKKFLIIAFFLLFGAWLYKEMLVTRREVRVQAIDDIAIKKTWESLQSLKTPNSKKVVFFLRSDRNYYYPEYFLPFKLKGAYMLPLAFYGRPFIDREMLGKLEANNTYINSNNRQYGYFTDMDKLVSLIKSGEINIDDVIGLHFIDGSYTFEIITQETRKVIEDKLKLQ